jgi:hypothetical protein
VQDVDSDEYASVSKLLASLGSSGPPQIDLNAVQLNKAAAKMNVALLSSTRPRDLRDGEVIDVGALLDDDGSQALLEVVPQADPLLAGRLLHGALDDELADSLLLDAPPEVLRSHAVPEVAVDALRRGDIQGFVAARSAELSNRLREQRARLAEPEADDHPPLSALVVDDG